LTYHDAQNPSSTISIQKNMYTMQSFEKTDTSMSEKGTAGTEFLFPPEDGDHTRRRFHQ
jgi:hypothetical protein